MPVPRKIVKIDEEKCDGCGQCVPACAEGAIQVIDGKARLVSEAYCDGLGACLAECPRGAIIIEERKAAAFDAEAVTNHLAQLAAGPAGEERHRAAEVEPLPCGCPGSLSQTLDAREGAFHGAADPPVEAGPSLLGNWPVQIRLVPVTAPYLNGARLLIAADCVPFAFADFHRRLLDGRTLLVGCPKLDDADFYRSKLAQILRENDIKSVDVAFMEVPCCYGLVRLVQMALDDAGKSIPLALTMIGVSGEICETRESEPAAQGA